MCFDVRLGVRLHVRSFGHDSYVPDMHGTELGAERIYQKRSDRPDEGSYLALFSTPMSQKCSVTLKNVFRQGLQKSKACAPKLICSTQ